MNTCKNCNEPVNGNYCPNCGQPAKLERIDRHYIIQEVRGLLFADKGFVYTIKKILISPGKSVRRFITEDRYRFVKPITFLFLTSIIYALVSNLFDISDEYIQITVEGSAVADFLNWAFENLGYLNLIICFLVAFWLKIFFKQTGYNLFEIFIFFCFALGITMLMYSIAVIIQAVTDLKLMQFSSTIGMIYLVWAIGQFFDRKRVATYIKAFLSYVLGVLTLAILIIAVILIELAIRH